MKLSFITQCASYIDFEPYRFIYLNQNWYLVGVTQKLLTVINYDLMRNVTIQKQRFNINDEVFEWIEQERFIHALPHFEFVIDIYRRQLATKCLS